MINVRNLIYTYPGKDKPAVAGIDFDIEKGEIFGFLGPNGAGKSTTQKIIIGLLKGYQGSASVFDAEVKSMGSEYYQRIGVAFEFPNLYSKFTGRENLDFFASLYNGNTEKADDLLKMVGLENDGDTRVGGYSKGMKMRLNFARAFLNKPEVIFLDEPISGLDPVNARHIKELIQEQKDNGKTIFLTTHNMTVAEELCDRVAFIVEGKIGLIDSPRQLRIDHGQATVKVDTIENKVKQSSVFPLENIGRNKEFISFLAKGDVEMIHSQEASLEDIFIKTTGRKLL